MKKIILLSLFLGILTSCDKDDDSGDTQPQPSSNLPAEYAALQNIFDGEGVGAAANLGMDIVILFNQSGTRYAWFQDQELKLVKDIGDSDSHFSGIVPETIGAASLGFPNKLWFFNREGDRFSAVTFDETNLENGWMNPDLFDLVNYNEVTTNWSQNNDSQFDRVTAMWPYSDPGSGCFEASTQADVVYMANGAGDKLTRYSHSEGAFVDGPFDTNILIARNNCGGDDQTLPMDGIGAACRYVEPDRIREIFFSADGKQFCFYTVSEGIFSEIYDLY